MLVYCIVISLVFGMNFFLKSINMKELNINKITVTLFFILYFILLVLRDTSIGVDTFNYIYSFKMASQMTLNELLQYNEKELGFKILTYVLGSIGNTRLFISVVALLSVAPILYLYRNECKDSLFCIAFFLNSLIFEMLFSGMRQSIAIGFAVPAFYFAKSKKWLAFVSIVFIATLFHRTAFVLLALYPLLNLKIEKRWLTVIIPLMGAIFVFRNEIVNLLFLMSGDYYYKGYAYLIGESGQFGLMILFVILSVYCFLVMDDTKASQEDIGIRNIMLFATFIHLLTPVHPTISRLNYYFIIFIPLAIGNANYMYRKDMSIARSFFYYTVPVILTLYFIFLKSDSLNVMNYKFYF